ncbi:DUF1990 domain-containing protein [Phycicoccus sp. HDW14]|nr:DUF1990 domain-containing protein [Phycicoccus sp. HDW14]
MSGRVDQPAARRRGLGETGDVTEYLSYDAPGATRVGELTWASTPTGYRRYEGSSLLGHGQEVWDRASSAVLMWGVKTRSGFDVSLGPDSELRVAPGQDRVLVARLGPWLLREPVRVMGVIDEADHCGFAYGTRKGHPVSGEEAFIVHRAPDGGVWLTLRSLTRPGEGWWRIVFPLTLLAQYGYRTRYRRALRAG